GGEPSLILGNLVSNGRVFLINPSGVAFGRGAQVDVGALVVSTLKLSDADFTAGRLDFGADGRGAAAGAIRQEGHIRTPAGGSVYLVAPQVENSGLIHAPDGEVLLAAGHRVTLVNPRTPEVAWEVAAPASQAVNLGEVVARRISMTGAEVGNAGTIRATTAVRGQDGSIVLRAAGGIGQASAGSMQARGLAADGTPRGGEVDILAGRGVALAGTVDVRPASPAPVDPALGAVAAGTGGGVGGRVRLLAPDIELQDGLFLDASGAAGGGRVLVGGGRQGQWAGADNAQSLRMAAGAVVRADATVAGDGGTVILWSDGATSARGAISARGGPQGGDGGFIETSGRRALDVGRAADASAPAGRPGQWLLDPADIEIVARTGSLDGQGQPYTPPDGTSGSTLGADVITAALNQGTDVRVSTGAGTSAGAGSPLGRITVNAPIVMSAQSGSARASLHLQAATSIVVNEDILARSGTLDLLLEPNFGGGQSGSVTLSGAAVDLNGGRMSFVGQQPVSVVLARPNGLQSLANLSMAGNFEASHLGDLILRDLTLESGTFTVSGQVYAPGRLSVGSAAAPGSQPRLVLADGQLQLNASTALLEVAAGGELRLLQGGVPAGLQGPGGSVNNRGSIIFSDASGGQGQAQPPFIDVPVTNAAGGLLEVSSGRARLGGGLIQEGEVRIGAGATLVHTGRFTNKGTLRSQGTLDLDTGVLSNLGLIVLEVPEGSQLPTEFTVLGSLEQAPDARIEARIGPGSIPAYQHLSLTGPAVLAGRIDLITDPASFRPFNGQTFDLISSRLAILGGLGVPVDFKGGVFRGLDGQSSLYRLTYLGPNCPVGVCWTGFGGNGDWTDGRNWSTRSRPPLAAESVFIQQTGGASVVLAGTSQAIASLETDPGNDLGLTGGSLSISGAARIGGSLRLSDAASVLAIGGPLEGSGTVSVASGRLTLADSGALAVSALNQSGGTIGFGGAFGRAALAGRYTRSGGTVDLQGTFDNTAASLDLGAPGPFGSGAFVLTGRIRGGTVLSTDATALEGAGGALEGVTLAGTLATSGSLVLASGLRLADGAQVDAGSSAWRFEADTALGVVSGAASVRGRDATIEVARGGAGALDIGAGVTLEGDFLVQGGTGSVLRNAGTLLASNRGARFGVEVDTFVHTGSMRTTNGRFEVQTQSIFTSDGTIDLARETSLTVPGGMVNAGTIRGEGRLELGGDTLTNRGTLAPGNGTDPGTLGVSGAVVMEGGSLLDTVVHDTAGASRLEVFGNVQLGGALRARLAAGSQPPLGLSFDIVSTAAGSTMVGAFDPATSSLPPGFNGAIVPGSGNASFLYRLTNSGQACAGVCWTGGAGDADWSKGRNWTSLTAPPTALDAAYINLVAGAQVTVSQGDHVVASLDTTAGNALTVAGGSLTVRGPARLGGDLGITGGTLSLGDGSTLSRLTMSGGRLAGAGEVALLAATHSWSGGTWVGAGTSRLVSGASLGVGGGADIPSLAGRTLVVDAGARAVVSGGLRLEADSWLRNAGKLILASGRVGASPGTSSAATLWLDNSGRIEKTGAGEAALARAVLSGAGSLSVLGGRLVQEDGSGVVGGGLEVAAGARWELAGGSLSLLGPVSGAAGAAMRVTGGARLDADGASSFDQRGELEIAAGSTLRRAAGLVNAATGVLAGSGTLDLAGAVLDNAGTIRPGGEGAVGTLTVLGGVVLDAGSVLEADLRVAGTQAAADRLAASGAVQLGGALLASGVSSLAPQQEVDLLSTTGTLSGQFARTELPAGAFGRLDAFGGLRLYRLAGCAGVCWDGGARTLSWADAANWSGDRLPGAADAVAISMASGVTVQLGAPGQQAASLTLGAGNGLRIEAGSLSLAGALAGPGTLSLTAGRLVLADTAALTISSLVQAGGTLELGGRFGAEALRGRLSRSGGELVLTGTLLNGAGVLDIGGAGLFGTGGLSRLSGTVAGGTLISADGSALVSAGGTLQGVTIRGSLRHSGALNLAGTTVLAAQPGSAANLIDLGTGRWTFQADATLAVQDGGVTLSLAGGEIAGLAGGASAGGDLARPLAWVRPAGPPGSTPFVLPAGLTVAGSGTLSFAAGVVNRGTLLPGAGGLRVGTVQTPTDLRNEGLIDLGQGALRVTGNLDLGPTSRLTLALDGTRFALGAPGLTVSGTARLAGSLSVGLAGGYVPAQGARFDILQAATVADDALTGSAGLQLPQYATAAVVGGTTLRVSVPVAGEQPPVQSSLAGNAPAVNLAAWLSGMPMLVPPLYVWAAPDPCLDEEARGLRVSAPVPGLLRDPVRDRATTDINLAQDDGRRTAPRGQGAGRATEQPLLRRGVSSLALPGAGRSDAAPVSLDLRRAAGVP
ncbi:MAG: filamentous hemagglutinin N-terminal domain-containing protein, partial [Rubrivivax sp.]